jgi:hypothetical protein
MSHPKRHHFLPESYLRRFMTTKTLWVYDIQLEEIRAQSPHDTGAMGYFNALEDKEGNRNFVIEQELSKMEGAVSDIMSKIEARDTLTKAEKHQLAYFCAMQFVRGPDFHQDVCKISEFFGKKMMEMNFSDRDRAERLWEKFKQETGHAPEASLDEVRSFILSGQYGIATHRNQSIQFMVELAPEFADILFRQDWVVLCTEKAPFITSDRPFVIVPPKRDGPVLFRGAGLATKGAFKLMPLSKSRCLAIGDPGEVLVYADHTEAAVRCTNLNLCHAADRFVIGCERTLVQTLTVEVSTELKARGLKWGGSKLRIG